MDDLTRGDRAVQAREYAAVRAEGVRITQAPRRRSVRTGAEKTSVKRWQSVRLACDLVDIGCENLLTRRGHIVVEVFHFQRFSSTIDIAAVPHGHKPKEEYNLLLLL